MMMANNLKMTPSMEQQMEQNMATNRTIREERADCINDSIMPRIDIN